MVFRIEARAAIDQRDDVVGDVCASTPPVARAV